MRKVIFIITALFLFENISFAQTIEQPLTPSVEQQLENITENNEDLETEDDSYLQDLAQFQKHRVNLNTATEDQLIALRVLNPLQINSFLVYRSALGMLINIYELQAVPGWDVATIQKIRPYIYVSLPQRLRTTLRERLQGGDRYFLARVSQTLERSRGYLQNSSTLQNYYPGSPQRIFLRYKYNYKNILQYGFVAEKDPGEQFFRGAQRNGFDFYSAHFFTRNIGVVKALAVGDFTVNMGQGLTQWMSLAFKKSVEITSVKRQAAVLRPYNSAGEISFHRGAGITVAKKNMEITLFGSYRKLDANFIQDTSLLLEDFISSLQSSGYHRTASESADKGKQTQLAVGGNASWSHKALHLGFNAIQYHFTLPLSKPDQPYNLYSLAGKDFGNYSTDYSFTFKNLHFFGEAAISSKKYGAFINGLLLSVSNTVDVSFLYRNISKGYQSLYTNAFTESTYPTNEKGFFTGISIRPSPAWKIDAFADIYRFPWLKYRVNAPTSGKDYMLQLSYKPNKQLDLYTRYKTETKAINFNPDLLPLSPAIAQPRQNWRTQFSYKINSTYTIRSRADLVWYDKRGAAAGEGLLLFADLLYKPLMSRVSGNARLLYFESTGYNSRLYAYENDVLYYYSIPVFFGRGYRYYLNVNYDLSKSTSVWLKVAQTHYPDQKTVGTGLDRISGGNKTDLRVQVRVAF